MFETVEKLLKQIVMGEDSSLELKELRYKGNQVAEPNRNSMADELAAMANTADGVFVLGVDDKSRLVTGIPADKLDSVENWIRDICYDSITPQLFCRIKKISVMADDGGEQYGKGQSGTKQGGAERYGEGQDGKGQDGKEQYLIRVDVPKSLFVHQSPGGYFERIGSSKRQMPPDRLARLFQQRSQARMIYFDEQAVTNAPVSCLEKSLWERFKTMYSPTNDEEFLLKSKILTKDQDGNICPTVSGILMACDNPQEYMPGAFIQAVAYRRGERNAAYQLDAQDITGPLDRQIKHAYAFVKRNMRVAAVKDPARCDIPQYSMQAVFEAIVNAVAHRDYSIFASKIRIHIFSERLEIMSPGSIPNTMTIDSLPLRQVTRNELLTTMLSRCQVDSSEAESRRRYYLERRGEGVPIIFNESKKLSNRLPVYQLIDNSELLLTIFAAEVAN